MGLAREKSSSSAILCDIFRHLRFSCLILRDIFPGPDPPVPTQAGRCPDPGGRPRDPPRTAGRSGGSTWSKKQGVGKRLRDRVK